MPACQEEPNFEVEGERCSVKRKMLRQGYPALTIPLFCELCEMGPCARISYCQIMPTSLATKPHYYFKDGQRIDLTIKDAEYYRLGGTE